MSAYLEAVELAREAREHTHGADAQAQAAFIHALKLLVIFNTLKLMLFSKFSILCRFY